MKICWILLFVLVAKTVSERSGRVRRIVGGTPAKFPPFDDPAVYLTFAGRSAIIRGVRDHPHYVFRGIRYAQAPTGKERFLRPKQHFLQGEYNATLFPPPCVQPVPGQNTIVGSEDCLFLNVFTPDLPDGTEGLPVVVWIHGGGFRYGSASQYGVKHLVGKRLIVVTIQYRLGSLGFLSTGSPELPGNAALWDMVLAVQWVRNHIGFFGGNPYRIVVMGHGTGASSALLVTLSKIAKGMTSAVIAMSGSAVSRWAIDDEPTITAKTIAEEQGCPTTSVLTMVKCLQSIQASSLIKGDSKLASMRLESEGFVSGLSGVLGSSPVSEGVHDGRSLPPSVEEKPIKDLTLGNTPKIPLLTGITRDETKRAVEGQYRDEIINKLNTIPNFLDKVLIGNLQKVTGLFDIGGNKSSLGNLLNPQQFTNYIQVTKNNLQEGLGKIAEATSDVLFNLPAFLTADLWSKHGGPSYLYRFEHFGKAPKGYHFLRGVPLIGNQNINESDGVVAHGDDLSYVFEPHSLEGAPINDDELNEEDSKVRDVFTQMIADFAKHGKINVNDKDTKSFSSTDNNFIQISSKPKVSNNFRYCEMALWAGIAERLQSTTCQFLNVLADVQGTLFDTVGSVGQLGNNMTNPLGGLNGAIGGATNILTGPSRQKSQPFNIFAPSKAQSSFNFLG